MTFTAEQVNAALDALANGDGTAAIEILKSLLTDAASGGVGAGAPPAEAGATAGNADAPPEPEMAALARGVLALFSGLDAGAALNAVKALCDADAQRKADSVVLEASERRSLVADLVHLGVEVPVTAWVDPEKTGAALVPVERLAKEEMAALRKRVSLIKSARSAISGGPRPPVAAPGGDKPRTLSREERAYCERHKLTPEQFLERTRNAVRTAAPK